jgi:hypothetical protein
MRESMPVIELKSCSSPMFFVLVGARRAAAVLAMAWSISWRCANAVLVICASFRSLRPVPPSAFFA